MKKEFSSKKSAFSLIELAIVLIIIGLLIAGVTGGAALIKSAELRAVITEARSNSISASAFFSLYDSLPGDSSTYTAYSSGAVGNGDGKVEFCRDGGAGSAGCDTVNLESEGGGLAWGHLTQAGVVNIPGFTAVVSSGSQALGTSPSFLPSKIKQAGWMFDYADSFYHATTNTGVSNANVTILTGTGTLSANLESATDYSLLLGVDAFSLDTKNDDGRPNTGKIKAAGGTTNCKSAANATGSATYIVTTSAKGCTVMFDLDVGN